MKRLWLKVHPVIWIFAIFVLFPLFSWTYLIGFGAGGLHSRRECIRAGQLDEGFWLEHKDETSYFPLANKCNPDFDLVPAWVNPSLIALAIILVFAIASLFIKCSLLINAKFFNKSEITAI